MRSLVVVAFAFAACSAHKDPPYTVTPPASDLGAVDDLAPAADLAPSRAATDHPPLPEVINLGGKSLSAPEIYTVVWQGDEALGSEVNQFNQTMLASDYWTGSLAEYGVGAGSAKGVLVVPSAPPATLDDSTLTALIESNAGQGTWPTPNPNTVLSFVLSSKTQSTMFGGNGCTSYGGYHNETDHAHYVYTVNLQCPGFGGVPQSFDELTFILSHEEVEAASDPHPTLAPAWQSTLGGVLGEIGDLCDPLSTTLVSTGTPESAITYVVTRLYSEKAAQAGNREPCVPAPNQTYFNVALDPSDISMNATDSITVNIEPYAFGDVGAITWHVQGLYGAGVSVSPKSGTNVAGDTIPVTITSTNAPSTGGQPIPLYISAKDAAGHRNQWIATLTVN
jgi:hypothetical protein